MHHCRFSASSILFISCLTIGLWNSPTALGLDSCPAVPGDLNGNLETDVVDVQCSILATLSQLDITGNTPPPTCLDEGGMSTADQNCDGGVTIVDVTLCIQLSLGSVLSETIDADGDQCHDSCEADTTSCDIPADCNEEETCSADGICEPCGNVAIFCLIGNPIDTDGDGCADACPSGINSCDDKLCGEPCEVCPPDDDACIEPAVLHACDAEGLCSPEPSGGFDCGEDPCEGVICNKGEKCVEGDCEPCPQILCLQGLPIDTDGDGCDDSCTTYDPCQDKLCGDFCTVCPPNDPDCAETDVVKACDPDGMCVPEPSGGFDCGEDPCEGVICNKGEKCVEGDCEPCPQILCLQGLPIDTDGDGCDDSCTTYDPCQDKLCGDFCTVCPPNDPDCAETDVVKACDPDGMCVPEPAGGFDCGEDPCEGIDCPSGQICKNGVCEPVFCPTVFILCENGPAIDTTGDGCADSCPPGYNPCKDELCGTPCEICPPGDSSCVEPDVPHVCDPENTCVPEPTGGIDCGGDPCDKVDCGPGETCVDGNCEPCPQILCQQGVPIDTDGDGCDDACTAPCDCDPGEICMDGQCKPYDPCKDKLCGDFCTVCPPNDPNCSETDVVKACDPDGMCLPEPSGGFDCGEDPCEGIDCPSGQTCQNGVCEPVPCPTIFIFCENGFPIDTDGDGCDDDCSDPCPDTQKPECKGAGPCQIGTATCGSDGWECVYQSLVDGTTCENTVCSGDTGVCQQGECICDDPCPDTQKPECKGTGPCQTGTATCGDNGWECIYQSLVDGTTCENTVCPGDTGICQQGDCICGDPCPDTLKPECKAAGSCEIGTATCGDNGWECVYQSLVNGTTCESTVCSGDTGVCEQGECVCVDPCPDTQKPECKAAGSCEIGTATCGDNGWECVYQSLIDGSFCQNTACPGGSGTCQQGECACFDPCEGLACGDSCSACPPGDPNCFETTIPKVCNLDGFCEPLTDNGPDCQVDPCDGIDCPTGEICVDGTCKADGGMIITEFMVNPVAVSDSKGEWIELFNTRSTAIPLGAISVADSNGAFAPIDSGITTIVVQPNTSIVIVKNSDTTANGGVASSGTFSFSLNNSGGDKIQIQVDGKLTDVVDYTNFVIEAGKAHQYDVGLPMDPIANDAASGWCPSPIQYSSGDYGTPGTPNVSCDEADPCPPGQDPCGTSSECLPETLFCDGTPDCTNGADEVDCLSCEDQCEADLDACIKAGNDFTFCAGEADQCYATCSNTACPAGDIVDCFGNCSPESFLGDGVCQAYFDCADLNGDNGDCGASSGCNSEEIDCLDGTCVPGSNGCDGFKDCANGADESAELCGPNCTDNEFECGSGLCIDAAFVCDGDVDCADNSDEDGCEDSGGPSKNCCDAAQHDGTPGCDDSNCETLVCTQDAFCCITGYDDSCAKIAQESCDICASQVELSDCCYPTPGPACDNGEPAVQHQVSIEGMSYKPEVIFIKAGDSITWTNNDPNSPHTVTAPCSTSDCLVDDKFDSGYLFPGDTYKRTFYTTNDLTYACSLHPMMSGVIKIQDTCEACLYLEDPTCFDVSYDAECADLAKTKCGEVCLCQ